MGQTVAQKIFTDHQVDSPEEGRYVLNLDAVFCHEITTPGAILDLQKRGKDRIYDTKKIKAVIDHVSPAKDSKTALQGKVLRDWCRKHGIEDFFDIGKNGVCHALFPEQGFVRPGYTIIMGDSHTCTHGAFGAFAAGVGTTDLEVGILKGVGFFREPLSMKIEYTGELQPGVFAKDVILYTIAEIGVNGATDRVIEFHGPIIEKMSMGSRMTLSNMAVEAGATCGICLPDMTTVEYLWPFIQEEFSSREEALAAYSVYTPDNDAEYSETITIDASRIEPVATFGYKPDQVRSLSEFEDTPVDQVYIGSCTNGRIEDLREAAAIIEGKKINPQVRGIVSPATPAIYRQAMEEGLLATFMDAGFCASTTNRNFNGRMGKGGMVHLLSPASAAATALSGRLSRANS